MNHKVFAVGIDIGHGDTKGECGDTQAMISFPSALGVEQDSDLAEMSSNGASVFSVEYNDQVYLVGNSAINFTETMRHNEREYQNTEDWWVMLMAALTELRIPSGSQIVLGTGLPVSVWTKEKGKELKERLIGIHEVTRNGMNYRYHIVDAIVRTQFYGAACAAVFEGREVAEFLNSDEPVATGDGGSRHFNFGITNGMRVMDGTAKSYDLGAWNATKVLRDLLEKRFDVSFSDYELMRALRTRKVVVFGNQDVSDEVEYALDSLVAPVKKVLDSAWSEHFRKAVAMFWTGGTPTLLHGRLDQLHPNTFYGKPFDNAIGYRYLAEQVRGR